MGHFWKCQLKFCFSHYPIELCSKSLNKLRMALVVLKSLQFSTVKDISTDTFVFFTGYKMAGVCYFSTGCGPNTVVCITYLRAPAYTYLFTYDGNCYYYLGLKKRCLIGVTRPTLVTLPTLDIFIIFFQIKIKIKI